MAGYTGAEHEAWLSNREMLPYPSPPVYWAYPRQDVNVNRSSRIGERILFIAMILLQRD